MHLNSKQLVM